MVLWVVWGLILHYLLGRADKSFDLAMRYGVFIPVLLLGLGLSFTPAFERVWEWVVGTLAVATVLAWVYYSTQVLTMPAEYGYVGLILITAFTYTLLRLRFVLVIIITVVGITTYVPYAVSAAYIFGVKTVLATLFLVTFGALGGVAAYRLERFTRLLFLRERQLARERERSDGLLLNVLPQAIVHRLKTEQDGGRIADALDGVSVVFDDAVGSTEQAARCSPEEFAGTLDQLFAGSTGSAIGMGSKRSRPWAMLPWPWPEPPCPCAITPRPRRTWPWRCSKRPPRCDGRRATAWKSGSVSPPGPPSPG